MRRGNNERQPGGPVLIDLRIDQAGRRSVLLDDPGARGEYPLPSKLRWRTRGRAEDHRGPATIAEPSTRPPIIEPGLDQGQRGGCERDKP
jgi:hypothetical protein